MVARKKAAKKAAKRSKKKSKRGVAAAPTGTCRIEGGAVYPDVTRAECAELAEGRKFTWTQGGGRKRTPRPPTK